MEDLNMNELENQLKNFPEGIDKEMIQDVIDASIRYGKHFDNALFLFLKQFPISYEIVNSERIYTENLIKNL